MKKQIAVALLALSVIPNIAQARRPKQVTAAARATAPVVTRDNFVSLTMSTSGGIANLHTDLTVQNNTISNFSGPAFSGGFGGGGSGGVGSGGGRLDPNGFGYPGSGFGYRPGNSGFLSNNQLNLLLRAINETRLPVLAGKYQQKNLRDGFNEVVTLTISDEANRDRTFTIENTGDTAPRAYYLFTARLRAFVALKFPAPPATTPAPQPQIPATPVPAQPAPVE